MEELLKTIPTLTEKQLVELKDAIKSQIWEKNASSVVEKYGYFITHKDPASLIPDNSDLTYQELTRNFRLSTFEHDSHPTWTLGRALNDKAWEKYLFIHDDPDDQTDFDADNNRGNWSYGDWDDPIHTTGEVSAVIVYKCFDIEQDESYYVIANNTGAIKLMKGDDILQRNEYGELDESEEIQKMDGGIILKQKGTLLKAPFS